MTRRRLIILLVVSFALRVGLVVGGGQGFWPDESRYEAARSAAAKLNKGEFKAALVDLFGHSDHVLFRLASLPAALLDHATAGRIPFLVPCYFALFSVGVIYLIWSVARRAGASDPEALWAAFFASAANSLFLYSRHYLPYDIALFEMMVALWLALGPFSAVTSLLTGCAAGLGFLTYNGYWLLGGCVLVLHAILGRGGRERMIARSVYSATGLVVPLAAVIGAGAALSPGLLESYRAFSQSAVQGDFYNGFEVIPEYLWYAERGIFVLWLAAVGYAIAYAVRGRVLGRLGWWLGGTAFLAGGLIIFSDIVPKFVVYGRLVRELVPFLCLAAAFGVSRFLEGRRGNRAQWASGIFVAVLCLASVNFAEPLSLTFPDRFNRLAANEISRQAGQGYGFFRILFAEPLYGRELKLDLPTHAELLRSANPMLFRPYQFEGYPAEKRRELNTEDVSMRLIELPGRLEHPAGSWDGYPGPVRLTLRFPKDRAPDREPLVVSGVDGKGDIVFVSYLDSSHVSFGLGHPDSREIASSPVEIDFDRPHELIVSAGFLLPPRGSRIYAATPELLGLRRRIVVVLDGSVILSEPADFYPATPETIVFGANYLKGWLEGRSFSGSVAEFDQAATDQVALAVPELAVALLARGRSPEWDGALGPVRLRFSMGAASAQSSQGEPLLSVGGPGARDTLYIVREGADSVRIGFERLGEKPIVSKDLHLSGLGIEQMDVSLGALLPAAGAPIFSRIPGFALMRDKVYVRFNGERVLLATKHFEPVAAKWIALGADASGSTAFSGDILSMKAIGPENIPDFGTRVSDLLDNREEGWEGYPGPLSMTVVFPTNRTGDTEPLLSSGVPGAEDVIFVHYDSARTFQIGLEHSGFDKIFSNPIAVPPGSQQQMLITLGSLMPPAQSRIYVKAPELLPLRSIVQVGLNGKPVFFTYMVPHPATLDQVRVGSNSVAGPPIGEQFHGSLDAISRAAPIECFQEGGLDSALARPGWDGYPGPLRMKIVFPAARPGLGEPILTTGLPGLADFFFLLYFPDGRARIGHDHWGSNLVQSASFDPAPGTEHTLTISCSALFPPPGAQLYAREPRLADLRDRTVLILDGQRILSVPKECYPSPAGRIILGANLLGGSSAGSIYSGQITDVVQAPVDVLAP